MFSLASRIFRVSLCTQGSYNDMAWSLRPWSVQVYKDHEQHKAWEASWAVCRVDSSRIARLEPIEINQNHSRSIWVYIHNHVIESQCCGFARAVPRCLQDRWNHEADATPKGPSSGEGWRMHHDTKHVFSSGHFVEAQNNQRILSAVPNSCT